MGPFSIESIAASRAHDQQCGKRHPDGVSCPAVPTADDVAAIWAGRARMADARVAAGVDIDDVDVEALARAEAGTT